MKIYIIGIPHTVCNVKFTTCAYTMKAWNLCRMMHDRGHHVVFLGVEGSNPLCKEVINVMPHSRWEEVYGDRPKEDFYDISHDGPKGKYLAEFSESVSKTLMSMISENSWTEIICCPWGTGQQRDVQEAMKTQFAVESGIGYTYLFSRYRVFESYAWMHFHYGKEQKFDGNGWLDTVIPNAFDPEMFDYKEKKDDYFLYLGRLIESKGVRLAVQVAKEAGRKIFLVGQGDPKPFLDKHVIYHPPVGIDERRKFYSNAACLICPTYYIEPFGGVNIEAQMSGTPVISVDWGAFTETVLHGITGYRCKTFEQFVWAARNIDRIKPESCRKWAMNFSLDKVGLMYEEYFKQVLSYKNKGFYEPNDARLNLDYLKRDLPV